jgi:hypothetical protein
LVRVAKITLRIQQDLAGDLVTLLQQLPGFSVGFGLLEVFFFCSFSSVLPGTSGLLSARKTVVGS